MLMTNINGQNDHDYPTFDGCCFPFLRIFEEHQRPELLLHYACVFVNSFEEM